MAQASFAELEHDGKKRKTRRGRYLERMDRLLPWEGMEALAYPHCPKAGRGRRPYALSAMLRVHCVQLFHNLSDPAMEDLLYEAESVRRFAGLRLSGLLPDETTILKFRRGRVQDVGYEGGCPPDVAGTAGRIESLKASCSWR